MVYGYSIAKSKNYQHILYSSTQEEDDTDSNVAHPENSGVFSQKRYRAGPDDPFRIAEEKRIAEVRTDKVLV